MATLSISTSMPQTLPERRHPSTPVLRTGFHFPESPEGSLHDLADRAQTLFTEALRLLENNLREAERTFSRACDILPSPCKSVLSEASGSDRAIYAAVQKRAEEVARLIQARLKSFGDA